MTYCTNYMYKLYLFYKKQKNSQSNNNAERLYKRGKIKITNEQVLIHLYI